ncbi:MAG: hypothetical protein ACE5HI_01965 [bacterium]
MKTEVLEYIGKSDLSSETKAIGSLGVLLEANPESIIQGMISSEGAHATQEAEKKSVKPRKPRGLNDTESVLFDMLHESTGCAMMDSGDDDGRHWQRNRKIKDFRDLPRVIVDSYDGSSFEFSKNIYHFLSENLKFDPIMTRKFKRYQKQQGDDSYNWSDMQEFAEQEHEASDYPEKPITDNSYNYENTLSQTIQYAIFAKADQHYIIIQIHQGADVRGGYTDPKVFQFSEGFDYFCSGMVDINGSCDCCHVTSDDRGYNWYDPDPFKDKTWNWSKRLQGVYCRDCQTRVKFS